MTNTDRQPFLEIVLGFAELKGKQLSAPALELYWRAMQHWELAEFRLAAEQLLRTCEFMPTPKDFEDLRKAGRPTAGEAWAMARRACGSAVVGGRVTAHGTCGDPLTDRAVLAIGGYGAIAMCDTDKLHFLERRFSEHYEALQAAEDVRGSVPEIARGHARGLTGPTPVSALLSQQSAGDWCGHEH